MIRFRCPLCNKTLKVADNKAGTSVVCPRCRESSKVPAESTSSSSSYLEESGRPPAQPSDQPRGLFRGMRGPLRWAVVMVAGLAVLNLLLAVAGPLLRFSPEVVANARNGATLVIPACFIILLVLVWAHLTSCPACGKPWARTEGETSSLERHVSDHGGVRQVRATRQTTYVCQYCRHTWAATFTDEYRGAVPSKKK